MKTKYEPPRDVFLIRRDDRLTPRQRNALNLELLCMIKSIDAWWLHASGGECGGDRMPEEMRRARRDAMGRLVVVNDPLVIRLAGKYFSHGRNRLAFDDALQVGRMGLMRAADLFSFEHGTQFSTYATWWVRQSILGEINLYSRLIRIPVNRIRFSYAKGGDDEVRSLVSADVSIDDVAPAVAEAAAEDDEASRNVSREDAATTAGRLLDQLGDRERAIVRAIVMEEKKLRVVGKSFGVSKERVRQVREAAVEKMVQYAAANGIAI